VSAGKLFLNYGATNMAPTLRRGGPISKHINDLGTNKNMVMGPDTKNDCAGEGHQQFTAMLCSGPWLAVRHSAQKPEFEELITEPLSSNGPSPTRFSALFWLSGAM
jgi:hypothetical protein